MGWIDNRYLWNSKKIRTVGIKYLLFFEMLDKQIAVLREAGIIQW